MVVLPTLLVLSLVLVAPAQAADPTPAPTNGETSTAAAATPVAATPAPPGSFNDTVNLSLGVSGATGSDTTSIPVLKGLTPTSLQTTITVASGAVQRGTYTLGVNGVANAQVSAATGGPVTIALPPEAVRENSIPLTLTAHILGDDGCPDPNAATVAIATVRQVVVTYSGTPTAPTTLADFFSPAVKSISLVTDPASVGFLAPAILQAASTLGTTYSRAQITTAEPIADPFNRAVRFVAGTGPVHTSINAAAPAPTLTIEGDPAAIVAAAAALGSVDLELATSGETTALSQTGNAPDSLTLRWADLGSQYPSLSGVGTITDGFTVPQARFGQPINSLTVDVVGTHAPIATGSDGTVSLLINDRLMASQPLGTNDTFHLTGKVAAEQIRRSNKISVQVDSTPNTGNCRSPYIGARVDIDAQASTIVATPGQTLPPGFDRFPQVFGHNLPVAFAKAPTAADLTNAVNVVASVARLEYRPLAISVPAASSFLSGDQPGLMINAGPQESRTLQAPLVFDPTRAPVTNPPEFTVTVDQPFAALEGFQTGKRDVLMLGSYPATDPAKAQALQDQVSAYIAPAPDGWYNMSGDVLFAGGQEKPVSLDLDAKVAAAQDASAPASFPTWTIVYGVLALIVLGGLVAWLLGRRRRNQAPPADPAGG